MQEVRHYCPLLLVCRHWYRLVIGTPYFWSTIVDYIEPKHEVSLFQHYLSRCHSGPLCLFVWMGPTPWMSQLCRVPSFSTRVTQLVYNCHHVHRPLVCGEFLSSSFNLESCTLSKHFSLNHNSDESDLSKDCFILPNRHRLRRLWLEGSFFMPTATFPSLEELRVRDVGLLPGYELALWTFLSNSPLLKVLELVNIFRDGSVVPEYQQCSSEKVSLDHLRALTITHILYNDDEEPLLPSISLLRWLMDHIIIPRDCAYCVGPIDFEQWETFQSLSNLADSVAKSVTITGNQRAMCARSLSLDVVTVDDVQITVEVRWCSSVPSPEPDNDSGDDDGDGDDESIESNEDLIERSVPRNTHEARIRFNFALTRTSMLSSMRRLRLGQGAGWTLLRPSSILLSLPRLETLVIADPGQWYGRHLWYTVTDMLGALMPDPTGTIVCPALRSVMVDCIDASSRCADPRESPEADKPGPLSHKFAELAAARRSAGHPIDGFFLAFVTGNRAGPNSSDAGTSTRLCEYDAEAVLLRTLDGDVAVETFRQEWERVRD
ncbi:hypothetical protein C8Q73DRAFT_795849 [Cubamyces lactineus]|nr:hypothetical protein C8Q73DRAFT_795849 [Cubamyces lactineus]